MQLPKFQTDDQALALLQTSWTGILNPILANPVQGGLLLKQVSLAAGTNQISHKLGRKLQGWNLARIRAAAAIYDAQDSNSMPDKTLVLVSDAPVVVDLYVF